MRESVRGDPRLTGAKIIRWRCFQWCWWMGSGMENVILAVLRADMTSKMVPLVRAPSQLQDGVLFGQIRLLRPNMGRYESPLPPKFHRNTPYKSPWPADGFDIIIGRFAALSALLVCSSTFSRVRH